jgi:broad specificity phosphatase PhoE
VSGESEHEHETVLVRHGETEWSLSGRHTGRTDLGLNEQGRSTARALATRLSGRSFALVLTSPSRRARETCELAGLGEQASVREDLHEWDYGDYEGLTRAQILALAPGWNMWRDGCPGGENAAQVGTRADRVIAELAQAAGDVAAFSHGHMLRVLGVRWIALEPALGERLRLQTASISILGYEHGTRTLTRWSCPTS